MIKCFRYIVLLVVGAACLHSCFKAGVSYTDFNIAVYDQSVADGEIQPSSAVETYAYYVDTTEWSVLSYEDALAHRITNKTTGEVLSTPDVVGTFDASLPASIRLEQPISMMVLVNPSLKLYAYRKYELPVNLPAVDTKLYMASWRMSHSSSGWMIRNDFYVAPSGE
mgnify:FL=1